jgi:hypothetical protein
MNSAKQLFRSVTIGEPADEPIPADNRLALKKFNPLALSVKTMDAPEQTLVRDVTLHGQLPWVWQASDDTWHVLVLTGSTKKPPEPDKYVIGPVLFYLMCLAGENSSQWIASSSMTLHVVYREVVRQWTYRFDQDTATAYLTELVAAILNQSMAAWLPFDIVTSRKRSIQPHKIPLDEVRSDMRAQFAAEIEDAFGEEADYLIRLAKPIIPGDAFDRVRKYLKIYFDLI